MLNLELQGKVIFSRFSPWNITSASNLILLANLFHIYLLHSVLYAQLSWQRDGLSIWLIINRVLHVCPTIFHPNSFPEVSFGLLCLCREYRICSMSGYCFGMYVTFIFFLQFFLYECKVVLVCCTTITFGKIKKRFLKYRCFSTYDSLPHYISTLQWCKNQYTVSRNRTSNSEFWSFPELVIHCTILSLSGAWQFFKLSLNTTLVLSIEKYIN